jgi:HK97 family phage major capsid protein
VNPYLKKLREQYDALHTSVQGLQTRAADENRDLTDVELRSVTEQSETAKTLYTQIELLTEEETRSRKVAELADNLSDDEGEPTRVGTAQTRQRDPGHYRSEKEGGQHSFFADLVRSKQDDDEAKVRLTEHNRSLSTGTNGTGIVPPKWLTEFAGTARQNRRVADRVRHLSLGNDPRPIVLPKQTGAAAVAVQASENTAAVWTDAFNTGVDTLTPVTLTGGQKVSRQLLDAGVPAVDELIYGDLLADYDTKVEARVVAAMNAAAGTATTAYATESAYTTAITLASGAFPFLKNLRAAITSVRNLRKLPPDMIIAAVSRYGGWLDLTDSTGRPVIPAPENGPQNAFGTGTAMTDGRLLGLEVVATDGVPYQTYAEPIIVARSQDTILAESATMRFRAEEPDGPETIRLAVWGYVGVLTRYAGASTQKLQITAA